MSGTRRYVCPECGYDGLTMSNVRTTVPDVSLQWGCPRCATADAKIVWMVETTDPRGDELAASRSHD